MNDLKLLKEMRRTTPTITPEAEQAVLHWLRREWAAEPVQDRWRPRLPRLVWRGALAGALGLAIVAGLVVVENVDGPHPHGTGVLPSVQIANAQDLGDRAARAVEHQPYRKPRPDQWIYLKIQGHEGDMNTWWNGVSDKLTTSERWTRVGDGALGFVSNGKFTVSAGGHRADATPDDPYDIGSYDRAPDGP
jgi:hypothetical protein